jgi:serine protease
MKRFKFFIVLIVLSLVAAGFLPTLIRSQAAQSGVKDQLVQLPTNQIIIQYKSNVSSNLDGPNQANEIDRLSQAAGMDVAYFRPMSGNAHVLRLPRYLPESDVAAIAAKLAALPDVAYAEPDAIMQVMDVVPNDPRYGEQWHYGLVTASNYGINAPKAWDITTGSASTVVAVIDTGITDHPDLAGRWVGGYDFISDTTMSNDTDGRDADPHDPGDWVSASECGYAHSARDSSWHGTHVAGTIGAATNNSVGVSGINWNAKVLPIRVLGKCGGLTSDIADGMRWAAGLTVSGVPANANPAKVLNLSLGGSGACGDTYQNAINEIVAAGTTLVISAGNSNADSSGFRPGNCNGVITVAATGQTGSRASYSNYGSVVEISAPGGDQSGGVDTGVLSTLNDGATTPANASYEFYQGTSMAAPHVAGVASLLVGQNPNLTPAQVTQILQATVTQFPTGSSCNTSICGTGILNAFGAVSPLIISVSPSSVMTDTGPLVVTISGANFNATSTVYVNSQAHPTTFVNSTSLTTSLTFTDTHTAGNLTVYVQGTYGAAGVLTTASKAITVGKSAGSVVNLPMIVRPVPTPTAIPIPMTNLTVINNTGSQLCYEVIGTGIGQKCSSQDSFFYGSFPAGTYKWTASAACGTGSDSRTYPVGNYAVILYCAANTAQTLGESVQP